MTSDESPSRNPGRKKTAVSYRFVKEALSIPIVRSSKDNVDSLYRSARSINLFSRFGFFLAETSFGISVRVISPFIRILEGPLCVADNMACFVMDEVKEAFPVLYESTDKVIESGRVNVLGSTLGRMTLNGVDAVLGLAESVVTFITVSPDENAEVNNSLVSKVVKPIKMCYATVTYPIRLTGYFIQSNRSLIQRISGKNESTDSEVPARLTSCEKLGLSKKTIVDHVFFIPRFLLQTAGRATCERSRRSHEQLTIKETDDACSSPDQVEDFRADDEESEYGSDIDAELITLNRMIGGGPIDFGGFEPPESDLDDSDDCKSSASVSTESEIEQFDQHDSSSTWPSSEDTNSQPPSDTASSPVSSSEDPECVPVPPINLNSETGAVVSEEKSADVPKSSEEI